MSIPELTQLVVVLTPILLAILAYLGKKHLDAIKSDVVLTKDHVNSRMTELIAVVSSEKLLVGEKLGLAKGMLAAIERQEAEQVVSQTGAQRDMTNEKATLRSTIDTSTKELVDAKTAAELKAAVDAAALQKPKGLY